MIVKRIKYRKEAELKVRKNKYVFVIDRYEKFKSVDDGEHFVVKEEDTE